MLLGLDEMQYVYTNKDTGEIACYNVPIDKKLWHRLAGRAERILNTVDAGQMPPTIDKDYICKTCPYKWKCKPTL
jgi:CRISPR/Cas system-associated exonuclease Cas4 (RecB family)